MLDGLIYALFEPIYKHLLFPILEPICWLAGSLGVLVLTGGLIRPSSNKKSKSTGIWGYRKGEQYYFDRELVSGIGFMLWLIFILIFFSLKFS